MENLCLLSAQQFCSQQPACLGQQMKYLYCSFLSGVDANSVLFSFFSKWKPSARLTAWKSCKSHGLLSNLLGSGHQEQLIEGCWGTTWSHESSFCQKSIQKCQGPSFYVYAHVINCFHFHRVCQTRIFLSSLWQFYKGMLVAEVLNVAVCVSC